MIRGGRRRIESLPKLYHQVQDKRAASAHHQPGDLYHISANSVLCLSYIHQEAMSEKAAANSSIISVLRANRRIFYNLSGETWCKEEKFFFELTFYRFGRIILTLIGLGRFLERRPEVPGLPNDARRYVLHTLSLCVHTSQDVFWVVLILQVV